MEVPVRFPHSPEHLFLQLHEKQGRSEEAAILAEQALAKIATKDFSDRSVSKVNGEYARIAVVTSNSAAKKSLTWYRAASHFRRALDVIAERYPFATTEEAAARRGLYWQGVYAEQLSVSNCLRDALHVFQTLEAVFPKNKEVKSYRQAIFALLQELTKTPNDQALLIFQIEEAGYSQAKESYRRFLQLCPLNQERTDLARLNTVSVRFFIRALGVQDWQMAKLAVQTLRQILRKDHSVQLAMMKQLLAAAGRLRQQQELPRKYKTWSAEAKKDADLLELIHNFTKIVFVGMDDGSVKNLFDNSTSKTF